MGAVAVADDEGELESRLGKEWQVAPAAVRFRRLLPFRLWGPRAFGDWVVGDRRPLVVEEEFGQGFS